ncbi:MAG: phospholipase D-like domain-containing protein [Candidatus Thorarchaeota archaeon]|jgi:cardiolipin synthase
MSNPFVREKEFTADSRDKDIGPAWFARETGAWEIEMSTPILSGGKRGGSLKSEVLEVVRGSEEILAICSFLLSDDDLLKAVLEASERGVRIYILTASKDRIAKDTSEEESWQKQMQIEHEKMLNSLCSKTLLRDAQVHAKFIISDPKSEQRSGVLSTANFTTEAFLHPELGVILNDSQITELFGIFCSAWWGLGERELLQSNLLSDARDILPSVSNEITNITKNLKEFVVTYPNRATSLRKEIKRFFQESKERIFIATYGLSDDDSTFKSLVSSVGRKSVKLLVRPRPKTTPIIDDLKTKGADVRGLDFLHAKVICTETERGPEALLMTANLEKISLQDGFEVGIRLGGNIAKEILNVLNHWWENANWEYMLSKKLGEHLGAYLVLNDREFEKHVVEEAKSIPLGDLVIADLASLEGFRPKFPDVSDAHRLVFSWTTQPRQLPKKCKPHKIEGLDDSIKIWKCEKNRIYISVSSEEELDKVLKTTEKPKVPIVYHKS